MSEQQSIKDTLNVIRKALEDDEITNTEDLDKNILVLNKLVKNDGTINILNDTYIKEDDVNNIFKNKLDEVFDIHFNKWLDTRIPMYLENYFKNKKF